MAQPLPQGCLVSHTLTYNTLICSWTTVMVKLTRGSVRDVKATVPVYLSGLVALTGLVSLARVVMFLTLVCLHRYWPSLEIVRA